MLVMRAGEARDGVIEKVELVLKCVEDVLKRYHNVMPKDLPNELPVGPWKRPTCGEGGIRKEELRIVALTPD